MFEWLFTYPRQIYATARLTYDPWLPPWLVIVLLSVAIVSAWLLASRNPRFSKTRAATIVSIQALLLSLLGWLVLQPTLLHETLRPGDNKIALVLDDSASMRFDTPARFELARSALDDPAITALGDVLQIERYRLSASMPVTDFSGVEPLIGETDFLAIMRHLTREAARTPLAAIVLASDGLDTSAVRDSVAMTELIASGVPVYTIATGAETVANDIALTDVDIGAESLPGSVTRAAVDIRHDGPIRARLRVLDGEELVYAETLELGERQRTRHAFELQLDRLGLHDLRFEVLSDENEPLRSNNSLSRTVQVPDKRYRVLHIEGEPRWEYKFIRRALSEDRGVELISWLKVSPNKYYRQGIENADELAAGFPNSAEALFRYDAIIIGSVEAASLTSEQHQLLHDFVSIRGGSLMLLGGRKGLGNGGWGESLLAPALPTTLPAFGSASFQRVRVPVLLTPAGAVSAFLVLDSDNANAWTSLPLIADFQTAGKLKPAATRLLDVRTEAGRQPLLVSQPYGNGRTFILATGGTWRWQMGLPVGDTRHETFWRQLVRELVSSSVARTRVDLVAAGEQSVTVKAQFLGPDWQPLDATLTATLTDAAGERQSITLAAVADSDGYASTVDVGADGLYYAEVEAEIDGEKQAVGRTSLRLHNGAAEDARIRRDNAFLKSLAERTGGALIEPIDTNRLAERIRTSATGVTYIERLPVWNLPVVLGLALLLKLTDWLLRRRWSAI